MNKPADLVQLLDELREEIQRGTVETLLTSKAILYRDSDDKEGIEFNAEECRLLLDTRGTVNRFVDALASMGLSECFLTLVDISIPDDIRDRLERSFASVDEE